MGENANFAEFELGYNIPASVGMDAADIQSSVLRQLPHIEEDKKHRVSLRIELREPALLETKQDGTLLWLNFVN